jgi:uncharacterized membrane protein
MAAGLRAFIRSLGAAAGAFTDRGVLAGDLGSIAHGINRLGQVAGVSGTVANSNSFI